jgi:5-methylthioadenosine/S-adenosylhomocysteine deaminase
MNDNPERLLIRGGQIYDHRGVHKPSLADTLIERGDIVAVGRNLQSDGVHAIMDARDRLVAPGPINTHYHSHTLCRGSFEELPLEMWLL